MAVVYQHFKKGTNDIFYVGIGGLPERAYSKSKRTNLWHKVSNKYGYDVKISHTDVCWEEACCIEKYLISFYGKISDDTGCLVNMTDGGDGTFGRVCNDETKEKISLKAKQRLSDKSKHPMFGKKQSAESIEKNRNSQIGAKSHFFGVRGENHPKFGVKLKDSHISMLSKKWSGSNNPKARKIIASKDGQDMLFDTIEQAVFSLNISNTSISACCYNKLTSVKGYKFQFLN